MVDLYSKRGANTPDKTDRLSCVRISKRSGGNGASRAASVGDVFEIANQNEVSGVAISDASPTIAELRTCIAGLWCTTFNDNSFENGKCFWR